MKIIKLFFLAFTMMSASANLALSQTTNNSPRTDSIKSVTVRVKGITCSMDLKMITANVEKVNGVYSCTTIKQGTTTTFEIKYSPLVTTEKEIFATIENTASCENPEERPYKIKK